MSHFINKYLIFLCVLSLICSGYGLFCVFYKTPPDPVAVSNSNIDLRKEDISDVSKSYVYINGAVKHPGVYPINSNSRLYDILRQAGGVASGADISFISKTLNISSKVADEQFIYIPWTSTDTKISVQPSISPSLNVIQDTANIESSATSPKINLNSATKETLLNLKGVGEVYALKIIEARPIKSYDALINVAKLPKTLVTSLQGITEL